MDKQQLVSRLIEHTMETTLADPEHVWLRKLLRNGFRGYDNMIRDQLIQEMQFRGMLDFPEPEQDAETECDDPDAAASELTGMLHGALRREGYD